MPKIEKQQTNKQESKPASNDIKADEKPAIKSPSQVIYETLRTLRSFSDYEAKRIVLALYGYFVTADDNYFKRQS
nr:MAG TPA: hypothetical protein [Caudoviricetes sp.]